MTYETPVLEIITFRSEDVIATSNQNPTTRFDPDFPEDWIDSF